MLKLVPITFEEGKRHVRENHRHHGSPISWKFGVGVEEGGALVGVAMAGRPVGRGADDGCTLEVLRNSTDGTPNACSKLYGAIRRAAKALGYRRLFTYTRADEPGTSLRAAGWAVDGAVSARSWTTPSRPRGAGLGGRSGQPQTALDLGLPADPHELADRIRWVMYVDRAAEQDYAAAKLRSTTL